MDDVSEEMRLEAISHLMVWKANDPTVAQMCGVVLTHLCQPSIGHLARFEPEAFDELYEEASAMVRNPGF
jgi:hypothetical protein